MRTSLNILPAPTIPLKVLLFPIALLDELITTKDPRADLLIDAYGPVVQ